MKTVKIHFLNTVWSDASIIEVDNHFAMIDTGSKFYFPMIEEYLDSHHINHLDFIFLSHFHSDHYGNIINLLNKVTVDKVYFREYSRVDGNGGDGQKTNEEYINEQINIEEEIKQTAIQKSNLIIIDETIKTIDLNGLTLYLNNQFNINQALFNDANSPFYQKYLLSENHMSVSIYFEYLNHHVYLGADLTDNSSTCEAVCYQNTKVLTKLKEQFKFDHLDIYKTTHHGGSGSNNQGSFDLTHPTYAIITNTNRWLDNWTTRKNIHQANPATMICQTDYYQYEFDLSKPIIICRMIPNVSLFITLNKN